MDQTVLQQRGPERRNGGARLDYRAVQERIREKATQVRILDPALCRAFVRERQERGIDKHDEVWDGVYVVPALPSNPHQELVGDLTAILVAVVKQTRRGCVQPGANVSDRREDWEYNHRAPDVVVVLEGGSAVDCGTHWFGGPDFIVEIQSPGDATEEKVPFYGQVGVRELLIIHRDTRQLRLYRHDGTALVPVAPSPLQGKGWLVSEVVPLAFRRRSVRGVPRTEVRRTGRKAGKWTV